MKWEEGTASALNLCHNLIGGFQPLRGPTHTFRRKSVGPASGRRPGLNLVRARPPTEGQWVCLRVRLRVRVRVRTALRQESYRTYKAGVYPEGPGRTSVRGPPERPCSHPVMGTSLAATRDYDPAAPPGGSRGTCGSAASLREGGGSGGRGPEARDAAGAPGPVSLPLLALWPLA